MGSADLLRAFRRDSDLEHMVRDKSWRDLWGLAQALKDARSPIKTLVLISGDVHHSYCMTGNLYESGRPRPELLQITCSGLKTKIRRGTKESVGEAKSSGSGSFDFGGHRLVPGYAVHGTKQQKSLAIFENAVALVDMTIGAEVGATVTYFTGIKENGTYKFDKYIYRYTSGAAYLRAGEPAIQPWRSEVATEA
jgi:hypothetical protein